MKDRINFDPAAIAESDVIGAYLRSADGTLITHTQVGAKESLDVFIANAEVNVEATDFDIRDLDHSQDNVSIAQGGNTMVVNADGSINVNADIDVVNGFEKLEDAAHASGDVGAYMLSVRQDALASSTSADGDYQSIKSDSLGQLWVRVGQIAKADGFESASYGVETVGTSAAQILATPLSGRKKVWLENVSSNRSIYIGFDNSVTAANGFRLSSGAVFHEEIGEGIDLYAIASGAAADLRYFEYA